MKPLLISALLFLSPCCLAQQVEIAAAIAPEDIGAYKWILSGTAQEGSVVVFRMTTVREWPDGKVTTQLHDSVHYGPGKKQTASAFFIDLNYFDNQGEESRWNYRALGGAGSLTARYAGHSHGDN